MITKSPHLALALFARYSTASDTDVILSASASGISTANSSSIAMTTSTVSRLSRPRSAENEDVGDTCVERAGETRERIEGLAAGQRSGPG